MPITGTPRFVYNCISPRVNERMNETNVVSVLYQQNGGIKNNAEFGQTCTFNTLNLGELGRGARKGGGGGGGGGGGQAGGVFGKKQATEEEMYFKQKEQEQLDALRRHHQEEIVHYKKEIEHQRQAISRHQDKIKRLIKDD